MYGLISTLFNTIKSTTLGLTDLSFRDGRRLKFGQKVLLEFAHKRFLLGARLEATMPEFRASVDPLEADLLASETLRLDNEGLSQRDRSFLGPDTTSANHEEILIDQPVMREATLKF